MTSQMTNQKVPAKPQPPSLSLDASSEIPLLDAWSYWVDAWQRGVLFLDVMQQRSKQYEEHAAKPPRTFSSSAPSSSWTDARCRAR